MSRHARCPSCGAAVEFKSTVSVLAVCGYCNSTLLRHDDALEDIGKMAALVEDKSPLQRGAEGKVDGVRFAIIGRIQLKYEAGLWNEWHLLFDDGKSGWLSEVGGDYIFSRPTWVEDTLPAFADLEVGQEHLLGGKPYRVSNIENAECVAGEGELPFKVGAGYAAPVVDLRDEQGNFATLDYSEADEGAGKPLLFVGRTIPFKDFAWSGLREGAVIPETTVKARAITCPSCGAGLSVRSGDTVSVGCPSCGTVLDPTHDIVKKIGQGSFKLKVEPLIAVGSKGKLRGEQVEVVGFMRRRMKADDINYYWSEYLLLDPQGKQLWLTESTGHWNFARVLAKSPRIVGDKVPFEGKDFKHFQAYTAHVDYVIGEFPWRVRIEETNKVNDYVAPPLMLSREGSSKEETWTLGEYIDATELEAAFALKNKLPKPAGVYANQPNPRAARHKNVMRAFWTFLAAALLIHFGLLVASPGRIAEERLSFDNADDEARISKPFRLPDGARRLEIGHDTDINNNWLGLNLTLVNKDTGESWQASRELSRYEGVDDGESWSEGSRSDEIVFTDLPPGTYIIAEDADIDPNSNPVSATLSIGHAGPRWSSLILLLIVLSPLPLFSRTRTRQFEIERWDESDHPMVSASDDSDDD